MFLSGAVALFCLLSLSPAEAYIFSPELPAPGAGSIYMSYNGVQSQGDILAIDVRAGNLSVSTPAIGTAFDLDFDPSVLTYDSYLPGNFFEMSDIPGNGNTVRLVAIQQGAPGKLVIGVSQNSRDPGASGSGVILTLKFRVASGRQAMQSNISISQMSLIDVQGMIIPGLNGYNGRVVQDPLEIVTSSLSKGTQGKNMTLSLTASGGFPPYRWSKTAGNLAPGLSLNVNTGVISGLPSEPGNYPFTILLRDSSSQEITRELTITVNQKVSITTTSLPETTAGAAYHNTLRVQGGSAPYTWTIAAGLPDGLNLIYDTGEIVGITSTAGNWGFTVTVRDAYDSTATKMLEIMVNPSPAIATTSVSNLYQDSTGHGVTFAATGGISPYTWSLLSGSLPDGLTMNTQNGVVSGTPSKPGKYTFTVLITDAAGITSATEYQWVILATPPGNADFVTPGSINRVDGYDLIALTLASGTTADLQKWNPFADFNGDQVIDGSDLIIMLDNFGKSNGH